MAFLSTIWWILLTPLIFLHQYTGITLAIGLLMLVITWQKYANESTQWRKIKLWLSVVVAVLYGLYDIYFYQDPHNTEWRFDLVVIAPVYYFAVLNWMFILRKVITI